MKLLLVFLYSLKYLLLFDNLNRHRLHSIFNKSKSFLEMEIPNGKDRESRERSKGDLTAGKRALYFFFLDGISGHFSFSLPILILSIRYSSFCLLLI